MAWHLVSEHTLSHGLGRIPVKVLNTVVKKGSVLVSDCRRFATQSSIGSHISNGNPLVVMDFIEHKELSTSATLLIRLLDLGGNVHKWRRRLREQGFSHLEQNR